MAFLTRFMIPAALCAASLCSAANPTVVSKGVWSKPPDEYLAHSGQAKTPSGQASVKARLAALKLHKHDIAAPRLFALLGRQLYSEGYFSDAIDCFKLGWETYKDSQDHDVKMFADLCGGELSQMYARIGRMAELQAFMRETKDRGFLGQGGALIGQSASGLGTMEHDPGVAFKCGPYALQSILSHTRDSSDTLQMRCLRPPPMIIRQPGYFIKSFSQIHSTMSNTPMENMTK